MNNKVVDHLFRHQYGKMVAILTRIFGLHHLQLIEDAVQDTFIIAIKKWRKQIPDNPEGWLLKAAKNRTIDLLRKIAAESNKVSKLESGPASILINNLFLEHEIEDSQLRMIFTACHPMLKPIDQIVFALKTISGFSIAEISTALLIKEETIKKRLFRARKNIIDKNVHFAIPSKEEVQERIQNVLAIIYLIFNEGFHSGKNNILVRKDLCGEAIRLNKILLKKESLRSSATYSLFAMMCFHSSRLESKTNQQNEIIDIKNQDRTQWYKPLINLGYDALLKSSNYKDQSSYHIEAQIAGIHVSADSFANTDWERLQTLYTHLNHILPSSYSKLNLVIILIQQNKLEEAKDMLDSFEAQDLTQRAYLYFGTKAEYFLAIGENDKAINHLDKAIETVTNISEKNYLIKKKNLILAS